MKICVMGCGYVGLVAGAGLAEMGNNVVCCDIDAAKIGLLRNGHTPIFEPGLENIIVRNTVEGRLTFTVNVEEAVAGAKVVILAVGTPPLPDGSTDLDPVLKAAEAVAAALTDWAVIVTKSTVPVGTGDKIEALVKKVSKYVIAVVSNPEFLKEGDAINDFMKPDRVIIGSSDKQAIEILQGLYAPFTRSNDRILVMDRRSAELTKYAANAMLATRISFMNDLAALCDALGADIELVRKGLGSDARIGNKFLFAGAGYGGSCFPKDLRSVIESGKEAGVPLPILDAVVQGNERQKKRLGEKILKYFGGSSLAGKQIAVWGLSFKPGTDDVRESPALVLIEQMLAAGAEVVASDPVAIPTARKLLGNLIRFEPISYECAQGADALVLITEWHEYRRPDFGKLKGLMRHHALFDGRNIWDPREARLNGFSYHGIGRGV